MANSLNFYGDSEMYETKKFMRHFDQFFDCLYGRKLDEYVHRRKPNLKPYTTLQPKPALNLPSRFVFKAHLLSCLFRVTVDAKDSFFGGLRPSMKNHFQRNLGNQKKIQHAK